MNEALQFIVKSIVDNPDKVSIGEQDDNGILNLIVTVSKEDMGKVIGKEGKVIRSIRNIMKIKAMKTGKKINISLNEIE